MCVYREWIINCKIIKKTYIIFEVMPNTMTTVITAAWMFLADLGGADDDWVQFQHFLPAPKVNKIKPPICALPELPDHSQELWFAVIGLPVSIVLMKRHISQGHCASHSINIMGINSLSVCLSHSLPIPLSVCVCAQLGFFVWMRRSHIEGQNSSGAGLTGACVTFDSNYQTCCWGRAAALHKNSYTCSTNTFLLCCLTGNSLAKNGETFLQCDYKEDFFLIWTRNKDTLHSKRMYE